MTIEPIIRQDSPQIRMVRKEDPVHIVRLPLEPIRAVVQEGDARHRRDFIRIRLHSDPRVVTNGQQVVDDLEAVGTRGVVDARNVGNGGELGGRVVLEEGEDGLDGSRRDVDRQLVLPDGELLDVLRETRDQVFAVGVELVGLGGHGFGLVDDGATEGARGWGEVSGEFMRRVD